MNPTFTPAATHSYRRGFESLNKETMVRSLPVEGNFPAWLVGTLIRNGPARFEVGTQSYRHWFDGLAMLHRFGFSASGVSYVNRFLQSPGFLAAQRSGRISYGEFGTLPRRGPVQRLRALFGSSTSDNANVNVVPFGDHFLALTETPAAVAFDGESLETRGVVHYDDDVAGQVTTAHAHDDGVRGATFNVVIEFGRISRYKVVRITQGTLQRAVIASIAVDRPAYLHAFSTTDRYVILAEYPLVVNPLELLFGGTPFIDAYRWQPQRGTRFFVIDKDSGARMGTYETEAFFAFHHINAFESADAIIVDVSAYDDAQIMSDFRLVSLRAPGPPRVARALFRRYRLAKGRSDAQREDVCDAATELPRIAPQLAGRPYNFAYGIDNSTSGSVPFDRVVKVDIGARQVATWTRPDASAGEPVFVPRPGAIDEDDGVVLTVIFDASAQTSYLLALDGRTLDELARAMVPHVIPFGFHGMFQ